MSSSEGSDHGRLGESGDAVTDGDGSFSDLKLDTTTACPSFPMPSAKLPSSIVSGSISQPSRETDTSIDDSMIYPSHPLIPQSVTSDCSYYTTRDDIGDLPLEQTTSLSHPFPETIFTKSPSSHVDHSTNDSPPVAAEHSVHSIKRQRTSNVPYHGSLSDGARRVRFLVFTKILFKCVEESNDYDLLNRAKRVVASCTEKNRLGHPNYVHLVETIERHLRPCVGEDHWQQASLLVRHFAAKQKERSTFQGSAIKAIG